MHLHFKIGYHSYVRIVTFSVKDGFNPDFSHSRIHEMVLINLKKVSFAYEKTLSEWIDRIWVTLIGLMT